MQPRRGALAVVSNRVLRAGVAPLLIAAAAACSSGTSMPGLDAGTSPDADPLAACRPRAGATGSPQTVADAVALINSLASASPQPVTLPCFLSSLSRPLAMVPTLSNNSVQPAMGDQNPRVFLLTGGLSLSVVTKGMLDLLELGQISPDGQHSIKGEIEFPIEETLPTSLPFERLLYGDGNHTKCQVCHYPESPASGPGLEKAFESAAFQPDPAYDTSVESLKQEATNCDDLLDAPRCALLHALFDHGPVVKGAFPQQMPYFR